MGKVPEGVPSLRQSSRPMSPSLQAKMRVPARFWRLMGEELVVPGLMSLTRTVFEGVPSVFQSSRPVSSSMAVK